MNADLEKENLSLKVNSNALNNKATAIMAMCELVAEYRQLNSQLLIHAEKLKKALNATEITNRDGSPVSGAAQNPAS